MAHRLIARESQHILSGWGIYIPVGEMGRPALMNELENLGCVILDRAPKQSEIPKKDDHEALNAMTSGWILVNNSKTHEMVFPIRPTIRFVFRFLGPMPWLNGFYGPYGFSGPYVPMGPIFAIFAKLHSQ